MRAAEKWSAHPLFCGLEAQVENFPADEPAPFAEAARRVFAQRDVIEELIADLVDRSRADPFFRPPFHHLASDIHEALVVYDHPLMTILLGVTGVDKLAHKKSGKRGATSIGFTGHLTLYHFIDAGEAELSFWEAPYIGDDFLASEAGTCRPAGHRRIADGETLAVDGRRESFVIQHAARDIFYMQAIIRAGAGPVSVEYDSKSRQFVGASSTNEASSRIQMMASLLRTMGRDDAVPLLAELAQSPQFYTRWYLMREMLAMDAEAALPHLRRMAAQDPHPEVRGAATQTLTLFFDGQEAA